MNFVLRISSGPGTGTCRILHLGQQAEVGGAADCDWHLEGDSFHNVRFRFQCTRQGCWVENSAEATQLKVNGVTTRRRKICDGDIISVAACSFIARIRGYVSHLQKQNVPLVGTEEFAQSFQRGVAARISGTWQRTSRSGVVKPFSWHKTLSGR